ncbi:MAG: ATP synthase subunit I [Burkholderiales bacterium 28-67-8]|nr:MAG: ATP synthase subunit I [Burkholderiales bacterium 28-67-8]
MVTSEPGILALALLAGGALGAMFFGGLWWTVLRGASSATPARYGGQADRLVLCLVGFVIVRMIVTRLTKPRASRQALPTRPAKEARHAP